MVANEVKNLAAQAKNANSQIAKEIEILNGISDEVVGRAGTDQALDRIRREYVTSTAAAVEEQSPVAGEMSANMQSAAAEARAIAG